LPAGISVTTTTTIGTDITINLSGIPGASVGTATTFRINATNACADGIETTVTNSSAGTATIATPPSCATPTIQTISPNAFLSGQSYTGTITVQNANFISSVSGLPAGISWSVPSSVSRSYAFGGDNYLLNNNVATVLNFGTVDFTIEAWIDPIAAGSNYIFNVGGTAAGSMSFYLNSSSIPTMYFNQMTNGSNLTHSASFAVPVGRWSHIAFVRKNSVWTWYINGASAGTGSNNTTISFGSGQNLYVGTAYGIGSSGWFRGNINSLRVVKSAVYDSAFSPPVGDLTAISQTALLTCIGTTIADSGPNILSFSNIAAVTVSLNSPNTVANYVINVTGTPTAPAFTPYSITVSADNDCRTGSFTTTTGSAGSGAIESCDQPIFGDLYPNVIEQNVPYVGTLRVLDSASASVSNLPTGLTATGTAYVQRSWSFPGNTFLTAPNNVGHQFGATPFTIEGWIYPNVIQTSGIIGNFQLNQNGWRIILGSTGIISYYQSNGGDAYGTSAIAIKAHSWNHFALVGNGTTIRIYVNGEQGNVTCVQSSGITSGGVLRIGRNSDTSGGITWVFNGMISNLRIVKGTAVYTASNFVPPSGPLTAISGTTLLAFNGNTLVDATGTMAFTVEAGTPTLNTHAPFMSSNGWFFDGTNDALSIASATALQLETLSSYTIEFWMYVMNGANRQQIIGNRPSSANQGWFVSVGVTANKISFSHTGGTGATSTGTIVSSAWNHVAICRNGTSMTIFINGVLDSTTTISNGTTSTSPILIGMSGESGTPRPYYGYLSNIRISNTAIYTSNFTPSRYSLPVTSQTVLLTCNNNSLADSSSNNFAITKSGTVLSDEIGSQSVLFNGSSYSSAVIPTLGTGEFTVECWVNFTNSSENRSVWQISTTAGGLQANTNGLSLQVFNNRWYLNANNSGPGPFGTVSINTWYHAVIMRKSGITSLIVNGTTITTLNDTNNYGGNIAIGGGFSTANLSKSYVSNLRVTRGAAIYASTFTPPTIPLIPTTETALLTCNGHTRMNILMDSGGGSVAITTAAGTPILSDFSPFKTTRYVFNITGTPTVISGTSFTATNNSTCSSANISKAITFSSPPVVKKVIVFGDSVSTYGGVQLISGQPSNVDESYSLSQDWSITSAIQKLYPSRSVVNVSRGGMTTSEALGLVPSLGNNPFGSSLTITQYILDNAPIDKIVLRYGLADSILTNNATTTLNNLQTIIDFAVGKQIEVILIGVNHSAMFGNSANPGYYGSSYPPNVSQINAATDINNGIISKATAQGLKYANPRVISANPKSLPDGIHPYRNFGYFITSQILAQLRTQVPLIDQSPSPTATYSFSSPSVGTSVYEGESASFTVTTTGIINGTVLWWAAASDTGAQPADVASPSPPLGSVTINSNSGVISVTIASDVFDPETDESFYIDLYATQADRDSFTNPLAFSNVVSILPTPRLPAALAGSELDCALLEYISQSVTSFDDIATLTTNDVSWTGTGGQVNVTTYGAAGNNSQSSAAANSTAISAAIAACPSGGTVYFPAGTYFISTSFNMPSNIRLLGAGIGESIIKLTSNYSASSSMYVTSQATGVVGAYVSSNICVENLVFDGNNNANRTEQLLGFIQVDGIKIIKCGFINNTFITLAFQGCRNIDIWGSKFANNGKLRPTTTSTPALFVGGVNNFGGANKNINVNKCVFRNNNWSASYFIPDGGSVRNCLFVNNGESTIFSNNDTNNVVFENNYFYGATRVNISASGLELGGSNFVIRNNFFRNSGSDGLSLTNVKTALVEYNTFYDNGQETTYFQYASGIGVATINDSFYQGTTEFSNNITVKYNKFVNVGGITQQSAMSFYRNKDLLVENTTATNNSIFNHPREDFNNLNNNSYNPATTVFNNNNDDYDSTVNGAYVVPVVQEFICSGFIEDPNIVVVTGTSDLDGPASPNVWGSGPYTSDSDVARAAVHAGLIARGETALIRKVLGPILTNYTGSTANGVTTTPYAPEWESMTLQKIS
jgi:hypothetical protein